jgi:4-amino-4-deoxy-L-arabinose transferase-like glycosyltransferase
MASGHGGSVGAAAGRPAGRIDQLLRLGATAVLALILGLSAFLQFYRLDDLQHFQGDEGILVLAARALIVDHVFPVYGLALAVGSAHIGPLFDYLIALPLWLSDWSPAAAVALNGICQVLAVGLCYGLLVRAGCGRLAGLVAALVYATAQEVVYYSRFLWPNMFPCVLLLILWSMLALREGRQYHLAMLGIWLGAALQLQPTGVLLVPFLALYLVVFRPPLRSWGYALFGLLAFVLLFAPAIMHDVTHGLVETKAWLNYSHHGTPHDRALGPTLARLRVLLQRLVGIRQAPLAAALGIVLALGLIARALWPEGDRRSDVASPEALARLIVLLCTVCLMGYLFFGSQLRPHYLMPLFPVPALALGLLAARWPPLAGLSTSNPAIALAQRVAAVVMALALGLSNVQHTWQAGFLLDRYQVTLQPEQSNQITLSQMRQVSAFILLQAGGRHFNLLFAAPDDQPFAYQALLLAGGAHLGFHPAALRFLIVQPADWRATRWPGWTRRLVACAPPPQRFAAGLVWTLQGTLSCRPSQPATNDALPRSDV